MGNIEKEDIQAPQLEPVSVKSVKRIEKESKKRSNNFIPQGLEKRVKLNKLKTSGLDEDHIGFLKFFRVFFDTRLTLSSCKGEDDYKKFLEDFNLLLQESAPVALDEEDHMFSFYEENNDLLNSCADSVLAMISKVVPPGSLKEISNYLQVISSFFYTQWKIYAEENSESDDFLQGSKIINGAQHMVAKIMIQKKFKNFTENSPKTINSLSIKELFVCDYILDKCFKGKGDYSNVDFSSDKSLGYLFSLRNQLDMLVMYMYFNREVANDLLERVNDFSEESWSEIGDQYFSLTNNNRDIDSVNIQVREANPYEILIDKAEPDEGILVGHIMSQKMYDDYLESNKNNRAEFFNISEKPGERRPIFERALSFCVREDGEIYSSIGQFETLASSLGEKKYQELRALLLYYYAQLSNADYEFREPKRVLETRKNKTIKTPKTSPDQGSLITELTIPLPKRGILPPGEKDINQQTDNEVSQKKIIMERRAHTRLLPNGMKPSPQSFQEAFLDPQCHLWAILLDSESGPRDLCRIDVDSNGCSLDYFEFLELYQRLKNEYGDLVRVQTHVRKYENPDLDIRNHVTQVIEK